jgi:hypothetical protein
MTASENQAETIVCDFIRERIRLLRCGIDFGRVGFNFLLKSSLSPQAIDRFVFCGLNDPRGRRTGHAFAGPLIYGGRECVLRRFFGNVEIAERPDEGGDYTPPVRPINGVNGRIC